MADITWTSSGTWQGGVAPGVNDRAVFDANSAAFTATQIDSWGGVLFNGYAQTLARGAFDWNIGAQGITWQSGTGTLNLGTCTVTNNGTLAISALPAAQLLASTANWKQGGGTATSKNAITFSTTQTFHLFQFLPGSYSSLNNTMTVNANIIQIDGAIHVNAAYVNFQTTGATGTRNINVGSTAVVTGNELRLIYGPTTGAITLSTFQNSSLAIILHTSVPSGVYGTNVTLRNSTASPLTISMSHCDVMGNLILQSDVALMTVNVSNVNVYGNLNAVKGTTATIVVNGIINLEGTGNQRIDLLDGTVSMKFNKSVGNIQILSGNIKLAGDSTCQEVVNASSLEIPTSATIDCIYTAIGTAKFYGAGTWKARGLNRALA